jgi:hypothetical protein
MVKIENIESFKQLIDRTRPFLTTIKKDDEYAGLNDKYKILSIIDKGVKLFPPAYTKSFLNPLKKSIENQVFEDLLKTYFSEGSEVLGDWISSINQRILDKSLSSLPTMAFTELCSDIYDGYVSKSARKQASLPESQLLAPLTRWGGFEIYTHSVRVGTDLGIAVSVISIPEKWSRNIALWPLSVHECYHDVVDAYQGLLNELEGLISQEFESPRVKNMFPETMDWNGEIRKSIPEFASEYWRRTMNETLADICSLLNIGPSAGLSFALFALSKNSNLTPSSYVDDPHPDSVLRIVIAREITRRLSGLHINVRNEYIKYFDKILEDLVYKKDNFTLYTHTNGGGINYDCIIPFKSMEKTIEILVEKVAFTRLESLGYHSLAEINSWTNRDQVLVERIVKDLLNFQPSSLQKGTEEQKGSDEQKVYATIILQKGLDNQEVYAAHIVAAATIALTNKPDIQLITDLALKALDVLYSTNPIWGDFPLEYRSDKQGGDSIVAK